MIQETMFNHKHQLSTSYIIASEMHPLFREVWFFLSFTPIKSIIESTSSMFAFHSSWVHFNLPVIPWKVNKVASTLGWPKGPHTLAIFIFLPPTGLKITAGHRTMSGRIRSLTGQIFYSPVSCWPVTFNNHIEIKEIFHAHLLFAMS